MKFLLELFVLITGVGSASGLYYDNGKLFIISDNSNYLYTYYIDSQTLDKHLLHDMDGKNEQVRKKQKMDLEAITYHKGSYHLFSSGSKPNRNTLFVVNPDSLLHIGKKDNSELYNHLRELLHIPAKDFNLEGALFHQDTLLLFNRGNGPNEMNGIIKMPPKDSDTGTVFIPVPLPPINGQPVGFTDAVRIGEKIYFLAAAESGESSYEDGKIGGSQTGIINLADLTLEKTETISLTHKFEGISLYKSTPNEYTFLLCEDPDNGKNESAVYQLTIQK